jgi:nicotinamidase-related amidase
MPMQRVILRTLTALGAPSVHRDDRLELVRRRAVHDHRIGAVVEFLTHTIHALLRRTGGRRFQPFAGNPTDLDAVLRNLGVSTIVVVGVSLNVAIPNVVMDAVNAAYRVVVPRDAVAGIPTEYGDAVIANTLSLLATITTTDELINLWKAT